MIRTDTQRKPQLEYREVRKVVYAHGGKALTEFANLVLKGVEGEGKYFATASALPRGETTISGENVEACGRRILVSQSGYLRIPLGERYGSESQFSNPSSE